MHKWLISAWRFPLSLARLEAENVEKLRHPASKNETDLELALRLACRRGADEIIVLSALGKRWDMSLSNVMLLLAEFLSNTNIQLLNGKDKIFLLQGETSIVLYGQIEDRLSLIALSIASGVTIEGVQYPL